MKARQVATVLLCGYVAAILQPSLAHRIAILGARPDFFLVFLAPLGMFQSRLAGGLTGFYFGVLQGALPTANLTHYAISRTIVGFGVGAANGLRLTPTIGLAVITTMVATVVGQLIWMFIAAPPGIGAFLGDTIRTAMYNGVLAMPVYALLKKILGTPLH